MRYFCDEISGHGSECRSSERPKVALVQPITGSHLNDKLEFQYAWIIFSRHLRWPITYRLVAQFVLVVRIAHEHEKSHAEKELQFISKSSKNSKLNTVGLVIIEFR